MERLVFTNLLVLDNTEIDPALSVDIDGVTHHGRSLWLGERNDFAAISIESCGWDGASPTPTLPPTADPPLPPTWPWPFSTDVLYGRDHMNLNLKMVRGDTYVFDIAIILNGVAVNLTGGTLKMTAKWYVTDTDATAQFQLSSLVAGEIDVTDAANGLATVTIAPVKTTSLPAHRVDLNYDIQYVEAGGAVHTVALGVLSVMPDVTVTA